MREGPPAAVGVEEERGLGDGGVHPQLFPVAVQERNNPVHGLVPKSIPPAVEENSNSPGPGATNPQRTSSQPFPVKAQTHPSSHNNHSGSVLCLPLPAVLSSSGLLLLPNFGKNKQSGRIKECSPNRGKLLPQHLRIADQLVSRGSPAQLHQKRLPIPGGQTFLPKGFHPCSFLFPHPASDHLRRPASDHGPVAGEIRWVEELGNKDKGRVQRERARNL